KEGAMRSHRLLRALDRHVTSRAPSRPAGHYRLAHAWAPVRRSFADAVVQAKGARSRSRSALLGVGGLLAAGCIDEGFRRCLEFWVIVFPLWCHYLWVDKVSHPRRGSAEKQAARDAEFSCSGRSSL
ncbi:unnamed protein product, partial [Effrenium voratum]